MKSILVPILGGNNDLAALGAAVSVARQFDSHIQGLYVHPNVVEQGINMTLGAGAQADAFWDVLIADIKKNREQAHRHFDTARNGAHLHQAQAPDFVRGASAGWQEVEGRLVETVARMGRYHDLIVLARQDSYFGFMPADVGEVVMRSGRPVLLVPARMPSPSFKTVCVAWKETAEAARALSAAMPFIEKASKVILAGVVEEETQADVRASLNYVADSLRWRAIEPEIACLTANKQSATLEIRDYAKDVHADLLVMGAYGHSRAREFFFGGMTSEVLHSADIPVLLAH